MSTIIGNRGITLAYVALSSSTYDRTKAMALCGGGALIGLTAGPSIQMGFTWIGSQGFDVLGLLRISMYTAPALLALLINISCIPFVLICLPENMEEYEEDTISRKPDTGDSTTIQETLTIYNNDDSIHRNSELGLKLASQRNLSNDCLSTTLHNEATSSDDDEDSRSIASGASFSSIASRSGRGMDLVAVLVCMTTRSARMLVTSNVESVGAPYSQIMFNFDEKEVLTNNSIVQAALGVLTVVMLVVYTGTSYTRRVSERINCIGAMLALLFFHLFTFSWFFLPGEVDCVKYGGSYNWCQTLKPVNIYIYYGSYVLVFGIALPCLNNSLQSLYSLVLGNGRQGTMQGINQAVGSLSRILGPLVMSSTFSNFGPQATWGVEIGTLVLFLGIWAVAYKRLVPASQRPCKVVFEQKIGEPAKVFVVDVKQLQVADKKDA